MKASIINNSSSDNGTPKPLTYNKLVVPAKSTSGGIRLHQNATNQVKPASGLKHSCRHVEICSKHPRPMQRNDHLRNMMQQRQISFRGALTAPTIQRQHMHATFAYRINVCTHDSTQKLVWNIGQVALRHTNEGSRSHCHTCAYPTIVSEEGRRKTHAPLLLLCRFLKSSDAITLNDL